MPRSRRERRERTHDWQKILQMEDRFGRIKKHIWPCICSDTYVKMHYAYPFQKNVWPSC